jgi:hypothetical protein
MMVARPVQNVIPYRIRKRAESRWKIKAGKSTNDMGLDCRDYLLNQAIGAGSGGHLESEIDTYVRNVEQVAIQLAAAKKNPKPLRARRNTKALH